jgi:uncharacterized protein YjbJ (UPF0337 family)
MSGLSSTILGKVQEVVGAAKERLGNAAGEIDLSKDGLAARAKGQAIRTQAAAGQVAELAREKFGDAAQHLTPGPSVKVWVAGYTRKDGTKVAGYYRRPPALQGK